MNWYDDQRPALPSFLSLIFPLTFHISLSSYLLISPLFFLSTSWSEFENQRSSANLCWTRTSCWIRGTTIWLRPSRSWRTNSRAWPRRTWRWSAPNRIYWFCKRNGGLTDESSLTLSVFCSCRRRRSAPILHWRSSSPLTTWTKLTMTRRSPSSSCKSWSNKAWSTNWQEYV